MRAIVLGAAAGGGLPQWNCAGPVSRAAWAGDIPAATQSSLAVSGDGATWAVINASPDLRAQILATPALRPDPGAGPRHSPIAAVLLTNGDLDHVAGLLTLRERQPFRLIATAGIHRILAENPVFAALSHAEPVTAPLDGPVALPGGLTARLVPVPGKVPLYLEGEVVNTAQLGEQTVAVEVTCGGRRLVYIPGCAEVTGPVRELARGCDALLFDGTLFTEDELITSGTGTKSSRRMGHVPITGDGGSLHAFDGLGIATRTYVHMNTTNPVWLPDSPERRAVEAAGWRVGRDGLEVLP